MRNNQRIITTPSSALARLDRIRAGDIPRICCSRIDGGIGDVLMTTPLVRALKQKYNPCHLVYETTKGYADGALIKVLQHNPYIDEVVEVGKYKPDSFDAYIDLTCPCIAHEQPKCTPINRIDLFAMHAQIVLEDHNMVYVTTPEEQTWGESWLNSRGLNKGQHNIVLLNPFSSNPQRSWSIHKWKEVAVYLTHNRPDMRCVILTHSSDHGKEKWDFKHCVVMHNYDIRNIAAVLWNADLLICPDSAMLHLGQALNKQIVALFGPTDPRARCNYSPNTTPLCRGIGTPEWPCILPGQLVRAKEGYKKIENIRVHDSVLTHLGNYREVSATSCRPYVGEFVRIKYNYSTTPLLVTPEHPILCCLGKGKHNNYTWVNARDIVSLIKGGKSVRLVMPKFALPSPNTKTIEINMRHGPKYIPLNAEICWLFGMYIAEGSYSSFKLRWTLGLHEAKKAHKIVKVLRKYFDKKMSIRLQKHRKAGASKPDSLVVMVYNAKLGHCFKTLFGECASKKHIPECLLNNVHAPLVLVGAIDGDGCGKPSCRGKQIYSTTSKLLALQVRDLFVAGGHNASFNHRKRDTNYKKGAWIYRIIRCNTKLSSSGTEALVRKASIFKFRTRSTNVYNLEVKGDNSYTTGFVAVHNCWFRSASCACNLKCFNSLTAEEVVTVALQKLDPATHGSDLVTNIAGEGKQEISSGFIRSENV